ncbi:MAG TPA: ATP-binding cassette domain-containing protein [Bacteroidota bacterium]|nr:ATP-binding cassette domain-containing protein [Bacteroidota bacterium]
MMQSSYNISIAKHSRQLVSIKNFPLEENRITLLFGESGIGKSLIAKALYGILPPEELTVRIGNEPYETYCARNDVRELQTNSFFVFQEPSSHFNPLLTLRSQIQQVQAAGISIEPILKRLWETDDRRMLDSILNIYPKPYRPSGGEKQRLLLAMAFMKIERLINQTKLDARTLFVFDEPSGSLDDHFRNVVLSFLLDKFRTRKFTVLLITHDYSILSALEREAADLRHEIFYKELSMENNVLRCTDFVPDRYLNWLRAERSARFSEQPVSWNRPILRVSSSVEVFGRRLELSNESSCNQNCALELFPFSMAYLKAASGVGKTSFAKAMMGLVPSKHLHLQLKNVLLTEVTVKKYKEEQLWGKRMVMAFQHADEALNQNSNVEGTLTGLPVKMSAAEIRTIMKKLFGSNIEDTFLKTKVKYLSGGQKQKLNLLRCLVLDTDVLILDEPFNGLDFNSIVNVLSILKEKQREGKGILIISHNEEIFDAVISPDRVYYLHASPSTM